MWITILFPYTFTCPYPSGNVLQKEEKVQAKCSTQPFATWLKPIKMIDQYKSAPLVKSRPFFPTPHHSEKKTEFLKVTQPVQSLRNVCWTTCMSRGPKRWSVWLNFSLSSCVHCRYLINSPRLNQFWLNSPLLLVCLMPRLSRNFSTILRTCRGCCQLSLWCHSLL